MDNAPRSRRLVAIASLVVVTLCAPVASGVVQPPWWGTTFSGPLARGFPATSIVGRICKTHNDALKIVDQMRSTIKGAAGPAYYRRDLTARDDEKFVADLNAIIVDPNAPKGVQSQAKTVLRGWQTVEIGRTQAFQAWQVRTQLLEGQLSTLEQAQATAHARSSLVVLSQRDAVETARDALVRTSSALASAAASVRAIPAEDPEAAAAIGVALGFIQQGQDAVSALVHALSGGSLSALEQGIGQAADLLDSAASGLNGVPAEPGVGAAVAAGRAVIQQGRTALDALRQVLRQAASEAYESDLSGFAAYRLSFELNAASRDALRDFNGQDIEYYLGASGVVRGELHDDFAAQSRVVSPGTFRANAEMLALALDPDANRHYFSDEISLKVTDPATRRQVDSRPYRVLLWSADLSEFPNARQITMQGKVQNKETKVTGVIMGESSECVALVKALVPELQGKAAYDTWHKDQTRSLVGGTLLPGTPIAIFDPAGNYSKDPKSVRHAAIFLGRVGEHGYMLLSQNWAGNGGILIHIIYDNEVNANSRSDANKYYAIKL